MTLEEKIKTKMDEYYLYKSVLGNENPIFEDGAKWMLSELKPVMEELAEAVQWSCHSPDTYVQRKSRQAISKYNELFKK